jgi:NAD+ synthase
MNCEKVSRHIVDWLIKQVEDAKLKGFVVGVSGGVDSGLVSTLCAKTGKPTLCLSLPIYQADDQFDRAALHLDWLSKNFKNVTGGVVNLSKVFSTLVLELTNLDMSDLAKANARSRLRMVTLYAYANTEGYMVVGTGNKIEDYGVGFFTKYGDGGCDISPIGDLMKSEVRELAGYLGVNERIVKAVPTDGLWADSRSDEDQIGASYDELEWALKYFQSFHESFCGTVLFSYDHPLFIKVKELNERQKKVLEIYLDRNKSSRHKMEMPPVCKIPLEGEFEIWSEGYRSTTGESRKATFHGRMKAESFSGACKKLFDGIALYVSDSNTYWGCKLFDNEQEARKSFG